MNRQLAIQIQEHKTAEAEFPEHYTPTRNIGSASLLNADDTAEVLDFLRVRPVHTVVMTSFITDNGIESQLNRGRYYGYRNASGELEGVALVGHSTLVEARSDEALEALAQVARNSETPIHLIMSSGKAAERFWQHMTGGLTRPRLTCTEALSKSAFHSRSRNQAMRSETPIRPTSSLWQRLRLRSHFWNRASILWSKTATAF